MTTVLQQPFRASLRQRLESGKWRDRARLELSRSKFSVIVEVVLLTLISAAAVGMRIPNLSQPVDNYDEGVYLQSLWMMTQGYRPFAELTASQGPLHLFAQFPFFMLFGQTVAAGRAASVIWSLVGLAGAWWIGRQVGGRWVGVATLALLVLSPTYLRFSRQALADIPALAPATLAVGAAIAYRQSSRFILLVAAGCSLALAILMKPIVLPAACAVVVLVWRPSRVGWRDLGVLGGLVAIVTATALIALGPVAVLEQVLGFRGAARAAFGWDLSKNWEYLVDKLNQEQMGIYVLALVGVGLTMVKRWHLGLAIATWLGASLILLLAHSPLSYHHTVILLPPLGILAGLMAGSVPSAFRDSPYSRMIGALGVLGLIIYVSGLPELERRDTLLLSNIDAAGAGSHRVDDEISAAERIARLTNPDDFVLTDSPYLAFLARRRAPPELLDPSEVRLRAGDVTDENALVWARGYDPKLVVLWDNKLRRLPRLMEWVQSSYREDRRFGIGDGQPRVILRR